MKMLDTVVETFEATASDGRVLRVERMESRQEFRVPLTGRIERTEPFTWYRCMGMEFTAREDGALLSEAAPGLVLRRQ